MNIKKSYDKFEYTTRKAAKQPEMADKSLEEVALLVSLQESGIEYKESKIADGYLVSHNGIDGIISLNEGVVSLNGVELESTQLLTESTIDSAKGIGFEIAECLTISKTSKIDDVIKLVEHCGLLDSSVKVDANTVVATLNGSAYTLTESGGSISIATSSVVNKSTHVPFIENLHESVTLDDIANVLSDDGYTSGSVLYSNLSGSDYALFGETYFESGPFKSTKMNELVGRLIINPLADHLSIEKYVHPYKPQDDFIIVTTSLAPDLRIGVELSRIDNTFSVTCRDGEEDYNDRLNAKKPSFYQVDRLFDSIDSPVAVLNAVTPKDAVICVLSMFPSKALATYAIKDQESKPDDVYLGLGTIIDIMNVIGSRLDKDSIEITKIITSNIDEGQSITDLSKEQVVIITNQLSRFLRI